MWKLTLGYNSNFHNLNNIMDKNYSLIYLSLLTNKLHVFL